MRQIVRSVVPHSLRAELRRTLRRLQDLPSRPKPSRKFAAAPSAHGCVPAGSLRRFLFRSAAQGGGDRPQSGACLL
ncbi:MAG: hypothetical protein WBB73_02660 [Candidatus Aminicenantaceae bacterium]